MAFIEDTNTVYSFADYSDVTNKDSRLFAENEGLDQSVVEDTLVRSTESILNQLRSSSWWFDYNQRRGVKMQNRIDTPAVDPKRILNRRNDFTDLCVFHALHESILPKVADFGSEDDAERQKIGFYQQKYDNLLSQLITAGDWYDFDGDEVVSSDEFQQGYINPRRIR